MYLGIFDSIGQWLMNLVRSLFFIIDRIVYSFIVTVYNLLVDIATTEIFTEKIFQDFADRIYAILGIFMLFKVSFNVINYIINPDEFLDKNKGFGKVITSIVISLTLLVGTPWIFKTALSLQQEILDQGIINRIVFGEDGKIPVTDPGNTMATTTFEAFCNTDVNGYEMQGNKIVDRIDSIDINQKVNDKYVWNYTFIISTLAGGAIVLLLVVMCFDIAVRNVKFAFLRILAPVPIVSRIDPKGKGVFDKWVKACTNTYLDLFIRLLGINLAVFIISRLDEMNLGDRFFVKVFIIFGVLLFAKQLPNLISDLFGVKLDGKFTMNPLKKLGEVPIVGGAAAAGATMAAGGALALGRGAANLAGGGIKKGAGHLLGNQKLISSGDRTLRNARGAMERRWGYTRDEAHGRFKSSGFAGGEYKGDTAGQMITKEKEKEKEQIRTTKREGQKEFSKMHEQWTQGDSTINDIVNGLTLSGPDAVKDAFKAFNGINDKAYELAYKSQEFQNSLKSLDRASFNSDSFAKAYAAAVAQGSTFSKISVDYIDESTGAVASKDYTSLEELYEQNEKAQKIKSGREKVHDTMRKKYQDDAKTQDALKTRKNNEKDPTELK